MAAPRPAIGWPLLPVPDASGRLRWPSLEQSVQQSIQALLQTRPGEHMLRPDLGAGLLDFVGQPNDPDTRGRIEVRIRETLTRHEDRIVLKGVELTTLPDEPGALRIEIRFHLRRTGELKRLGLTLALEQG